MDYLDHVDLTRHISFDEFNTDRLTESRRLMLATVHANLALHEVTFEPTDIILLGRESAGVPDAVHEASDQRFSIPMRAGLRSLNVAITAAISLAEALRQTGQFYNSE